MVEIHARLDAEIELGRRGENLAHAILFDVSDWEQEYGAGVVHLLHQRPGDAAPYPCSIEVNGTQIRWEIADTDIANVGRGRAELQYYIEDVIVKSRIYHTRTFRALDEAGPVPDDPAQSWVEQVLKAGTEAVNAEKNAKEYAADAGLQAAHAQSYSVHPPYIGENGTWMIWNGTGYDDSKQEVLNDVVDMIQVGAGVRHTLDGTALFAGDARLKTCTVWSKIARGESDAIRFHSVGVKTEGAGTVRFALYEVIRGEDGVSGTLKRAEVLGEVVMEADGIARLDFAEGYYTDLDEVVVLALSDQDMLVAVADMGFVFNDWVIIENNDYTEAAEIPCEFGNIRTGAAFLLDYSPVDFMTLAEFANDTAQRFADADERLDDLEEQAVPSTFLVPDGYVLTVGGPTEGFGQTNKFVWAKPNHVEVDEALENTGQAADAKVVGDRLEAVEKNIADLMYEPISITSFAHNLGTREIGETVTEYKLSWTTNKTPESLSWNGNHVAATATNVSVTDAEITGNRTWTLEATDERGAVATETTTVSFLNGVYYGAAAAPDAIDSAFVLGLTRTLTGTRSRTVTVNVADGQYAWYCLPTRLGTCTFTVGGFEGGFELVDTISFTNASGYTENYYVYRSSNASLGSTKVVVS